MKVQTALINKNARYPEMVVSGLPHELGRQIGEATREQIRGFCQVALDRVHRIAAITPQRATDIARRSLEFATSYSPDMVKELRGIADAAGVTIDDLMLLQVRNQLLAENEAGCTSLSLPSGTHRGPMVAQNWDNDPVLDQFTVVLTRRPEGKPAFITCTQAGLISYVGFNAEGIGACMNTLPAPSRDAGVPAYFTLRGIYEASSLESAVDAVRRAHRAIPINLMMTTPQGPADLEVTIDDVQVLRSDTGLTHTNHCTHSDLVSINDDFPELIQSHPRLGQINTLLTESSDEPDIEEVKKMLSDHRDHPTSICRHANDEPAYGFWETVFSIIIEPDARRMHVSRGNPCCNQYEVYELQM